MFTVKKKHFAIAVIVIFMAGAAVPIATMATVRAIGGEQTVLSAKAYAEYKAFKEHYGKLMDLDAYIKERYYLPVEDTLLETGAYKGLFAGLGDRYTIYYTAEEYAKEIETAQGEFSGIGAVIHMDEDESRMRIESLIEGGAAEKAALRIGDVILLVDGEDYAGESLNEAVGRLRGSEGSKVRLRILRDGHEFDVTLTRAIVVTPSVAGRVLDDNIAYIQIASFGNHTAEDFEKKLTEMEEAGADGLVIDLRNNPGGIVDSGVKIADLLLDAGTVATVSGSEEPYVSRDGATRLPYVLLVNEGTASTSEILAGAIQDNGGGSVVGTRTTGKGIIQRLEQFKDGDGARITVAQYFTPNGNAVHGIGITPDYVVEIEDDDDTRDVQLEKAVALLTGK